MDELTSTEISKVLETEMVGHIGVIDDGLPYVSPVSYVIIGSEFCFRTGAGRRIDAIRKNPNVSIEVVRIDNSRWESVIAAGVARELVDDHHAQLIIAGLLAKYSAQIGSPLTGGAPKPVYEPGILVAVALSDVTGRSSGSWFSIPTRPGRL